MRHFVLIYALFCVSFSQAQYTFHGKIVDSLKIAIGYGYEFHGSDSSGYNVTDAWLLARYDSVDHCYKARTQEKWFLEVVHPGMRATVRKPTKDRSAKSPKNTSGALDSLFLNSKSSLTFDDFQLTRRQWKRYTKARVVNRYMKNHDKEFMWIDRQEKTVFLKGLHSIDTFNLFLNQNLNPGNFEIITGVSDIVSLDIYTEGKCFSLISRTGSLFRLPWWKSEDEQLISQEGMLSLEINRFLLSWLPKDFFNRESLEPKMDIQYQYLFWYSHRSGLIY